MGYRFAHIITYLHKTVTFFKEPTLSLVGPTKLLIVISPVSYVIMAENLSKNISITCKVPICVNGKVLSIVQNHHPIAQNCHHFVLLRGCRIT